MIDSHSLQVYLQLTPGENHIRLTTAQSELSIMLVFSPSTANSINMRLLVVSFADEIDKSIEHRCRQLAFLTKLVRCTFDELLYKQTRSRCSAPFNVEKQVHHVSMSRGDFADKSTDKDVFKEIYRQIYAMELGQEPQMKLVVDSNLASALTFASSKCSCSPASDWISISSVSKSDRVQSAQSVRSPSCFVR